MRQEILQLGSDTLSYTLRRSRRAKRLLLHVDVSGKVELVVPWHASYAEGRNFIKAKHAWIEKQLAAQEIRRAQVPKRILSTGTILPLLGRGIRLEVRGGERTHTRMEGEALYITACNVKHVRRAIEAWYRRQARTFFVQEARTLAAYITPHPVTVRITGARTLWGSCNPRRRSISFTWRLALAPAHVAVYVAAHEVAHLRYARHSKQFWQLVGKLNPEYMESRTYLRRYGHMLEL